MWAEETGRFVHCILYQCLSFAVIFFIYILLRHRLQSKRLYSVRPISPIRYLGQLSLAYLRGRLIEYELRLGVKAGMSPLPGCR